MARFFKQSHYRDKPKEGARLLCWCKKRVGYLSFKLPEIVSTRFISLVATGVHSTFKEGREDLKVDITKFIPYGVSVPSL